MERPREFCASMWTSASTWPSFARGVLSVSARSGMAWQRRFTHGTASPPPSSRPTMPNPETLDLDAIEARRAEFRKMLQTGVLTVAGCDALLLDAIYDVDALIAAVRERDAEIARLKDVVGQWERSDGRTSRKWDGLDFGGGGGT